MLVFIEKASVSYRCGSDVCESFSDNDNTWLVCVLELGLEHAAAAWSPSVSIIGSGELGADPGDEGSKNNVTIIRDSVCVANFLVFGSIYHIELVGQDTFGQN